MVNKKPGNNGNLGDVTWVNQELLNAVEAEQNKTALLIQDLLKMAEDYEKSISESTAQTAEQVEKTKKTVELLLDLSAKITNPDNDICADISSQSLHVIGEAIKNQQFFASQLIEKNQEITNLKIQTQELTHKAFYDELTWLGNRHLFKKTFLAFKNDFVEKWQIFSMAMFDLDDFKQINDQYSHEVWDKALNFFSNRLRDFFSEKLWEKWILLRLWWEEFGVLSQIWKKEMYNLMESFRKKASKTYELKHKKPWEPEEKEQIKLTFSWWVVEFKDKLSANQIHKECGEKLKEAKKKWKNVIIK
ncbi:MAG: hypothetical protein ACD_49C00077G0016 [uncultured bacterium (gcode 4)]|uniref:GGDEF domain-containing protein n=1 Tax=uncultured bacterium (gcode 4) TaxID=1234023 RepID=K2BAU7_9BACT|nr:MAG: hypothetical protein ACD_49C00077G0016 [uncultured bacterium (gcode 4)]